VHLQSKFVIIAPSSVLLDFALIACLNSKVAMCSSRLPKPFLHVSPPSLNFLAVLILAMASQFIGGVYTPRPRNSSFA